MLDNFLVRALLAGLGIAIIAGPLGSLIVWRRMSYFGDTLAHSTLLGVGLAIVLNLHLYLGLIGICLLIGVLLVFFLKQQILSSDTVLGLLSHTSLALGLIFAVKLQGAPGANMNLLGYLYGDILSVTYLDLLWIAGIDILGLAILGKYWRWLLAITVQENLAKVDGIPVEKMRWLFILVMSAVFAIAIKLVGVLLITALMIIPAAAARQLAGSPLQMALLASGIGGLAVAGGLACSWYLDWPAGPSVVVTGALLFVIANLCSIKRAR